jgi:hypothetical protein
LLIRKGQHSIKLYYYGEHLIISEAPSFWSQVWQALQRAIALAIFMVVHWALNKGLERIVPGRLGWALELAQSVVFVFFLMIYVYLSWDMLTMFVPRLRSRAEAKILAEEVERK